MAAGGSFTWDELLTRGFAAAKRFDGERSGWCFEARPMPAGVTFGSTTPTRPGRRAHGHQRRRDVRRTAAARVRVYNPKLPITAVHRLDAGVLFRGGGGEDRGRPPRRAMPSRPSLISRVRRRACTALGSRVLRPTRPPSVRALPPARSHRGSLGQLATLLPGGALAWVDVDDRLRRLKAARDPPARLAAVVDVKVCRDGVELARLRSDQAEGGRPSDDAVRMFGLLVLQRSTRCRTSRPRPKCASGSR